MTEVEMRSERPRANKPLTDDDDRLSIISFELTQDEIAQLKREYADEVREDKKKEDEVFKEIVKNQIQKSNEIVDEMV